MTTFHWTGLEIGTLTIAAASLLAFVWMQWEKRRDEREIAVAAAGSADRQQWRTVEREHLFQRQADEAVAMAEYFCRYDVYEQGLSLFADYADRFPMPQRPARPEPAPGEPWQQQVKNDTLAPRLVEPGAPENDPRGDLL